MMATKKNENDQEHRKEAEIEDLANKVQEQLDISSDSTKILESTTLDGVASYIKSGKCCKIITMAGAGISTSAGIPDFRSPNTGLYRNLQKYDLPDPECIFSIDYFKLNPKPFFELAKNLWPGSFKPTPCHYFLKLLSQKGLLLRHYTQNIDTLERVAGLEEEKLVEAHGTFNTAHCMTCHTQYKQDWLKDQIMRDVVPTCNQCNGVVKPDVVLFGESLPNRFITLVQQDLDQCDLLIILGTSLQVQPFASLIGRVPSHCPRLYINRDKMEESGTDFLTRLLFGESNAFNFDGDDNCRDVFWKGDCDDGCLALADRLGWRDDLNKLMGVSVKISNKDDAPVTSTSKKH